FAGGTFEPGTPPNAVLLASVYDCQGALAEGVSFRAEGSQTERTKTFYTDDGRLVSPSATETSSAGTFGMTNLSDGRLTLGATLNPGQALGTALSVFARDGHLTQVFVSPE
ncbi:MAG TPA: hypothetical protein VFS00_11570, partial [Polyangiaceae bacterium]|nr:hypothetical protein [Polyangiaceae bacterium]